MDTNKCTERPFESEAQNAYAKALQDEVKYRISQGYSEDEAYEISYGIAQDVYNYIAKKERLQRVLSAAAPELLAALENIAEMADNSGDRAILETARAAIAKAKGELICIYIKIWI